MEQVLSTRGQVAYGFIIVLQAYGNSNFDVMGEEMRIVKKIKYRVSRDWAFRLSC